MRRVEASNNLIGGVSVREDADGDLRSRLERVVAEANSGRGIDFDENGAGSLAVRASASTSLTNGDVDLRADQQAPGTGAFLLKDVTFSTSGGNVPPTLVP